ncbi:MAG: cobalt ABC transporter permease [Thermodesulfovibrionales bacterium]|jgi:ABC-type cobalt transport system substrate-binding protein
MKALAAAGVFLLLLSILCNLSIAIADQEKWTGVDESVVQKIAKEHGREAHKPLINTDQGDMLLFVFLVAGSIGGFVAGYYWKILMGKPATSEKEKTTG